MPYIPDPITRKEHYMSYLTGNTTYYPKDSLTREEQYLLYLCENKGIGGGVTPEQIQAAVDAYLEENPPSGMTPEQIQELDGKLDSDQGTENAGKFMKVGEDGTLTPADAPGGSYTLPIMSDTQLGGGKAVEKTDEDVPVAVDPSTGQLFVPTYPGSTGGSADIPRQEMQNTDTTVTLDPNKLYVFPEMASLTVTLAEPEDTNVVNEYHFFFTSGATATTLTLNNVLSGAYSIEANMKYEVSILEGVAYIKGVAVNAET